MILLMHIIIALMSVAVASATFVKPSTKRLATSYGFIIATVASGTYLIMTMSTSILKSCLVGLAYVTTISVVTIAAHVRMRRATLAYQESK